MTGALVIAPMLSSCVHTNSTGAPASAADPPTAQVQMSSAMSTAVALDREGNLAVYVEAIAEVNAYLDAWARHGPIVAAALYNVATLQAHRDAETPQAWRGPLFLISGQVTDYRPYAWVSTRQFTLLITMKLHFTGSDPAASAWAEGRNGRYVTFSRPNADALYRMSWATGP